MLHSVSRASFLLVIGVSLAMTACGSQESSEAGPEAVAIDAEPGTGANQGDRTTEAWAAQARQANAAATPDDIAAETTAAGRALAEACGFSAAEKARFQGQEDGSQRGPGFEARVEQRMAHARAAMQAQQQENGAAFKENCEFVRFMMDKRG